MIIKEATILAANAVGAPMPIKNADGVIVGYKKTGAGGLQGYLEHIALNEPKSFVALMARILPMQINHSTSDKPVEDSSYEELLERLRKRGLPIDQMMEDVSDADIIDAEVIANDTDDQKLLSNARQHKSKE